MRLARRARRSQRTIEDGFRESSFFLPPCRQATARIHLCKPFSGEHTRLARWRWHPRHRNLSDWGSVRAPRTMPVGLGFARLAQTNFPLQRFNDSAPSCLFSQPSTLNYQLRRAYALHERSIKREAKLGAGNGLLRIWRRYSFESIDHTRKNMARLSCSDFTGRKDPSHALSHRECAHNNP